MNPETLAHLSKADPVMRKLIRKVGDCLLAPESRRSPFESLVRAVAHQQLNGTAAERILGRFEALFPKKRFPSAEDIETVTDEQLRGAGFSRAKILSIRDIAAKTMEGVIPTARKIDRLSDDEIVERLVTVRGVGRWTVEMLLIFQLGRPDVLPVDDFGVRSGFKIALDLPEMPRPKELLAYGERWRPFRTTAAWYLWRATDKDKKVSDERKKREV